jgi:uncharacterized MAPEG superfamily protein
MKTELWYLALETAFTGLLWFPYVCDRTKVWGLADTVGYPANPKPLDGWAERLKRAHANAVENLVVFATLVLTANAMGISGGAVATAAVLYFWSRVVHAVAYTAAWPWIRTFGFTGGWIACVIVAWQILVR